MPLPVIGYAVGGLSTVLARFLVPYIITKIILTLGLSLVTFVGVDLLGDYLVSEVRAASSGIGSDLINILAIAGAFDWLEIVLAAWMAAINIKSLRGAFQSLRFSGGS